MATVMECRYEVLAQQGDALQIIFEGLPWGVIVADREGKLLFSNPAAERILGIGIVEAQPDAGASLEGWYLPDQISVVPPDQLPLVRAIRGQEVLDELIFVRRSHQRPGVWIRVNAWPLKDAAGVVSGGVVMFHDFTQGREAIQSFVLLSRVVEQTADSVVLTDTQGVGLSPRRITLSTSGIIPKIVELGEQPVRPKLAISLNASTEEQRRELMPITSKYHLADLIVACKHYPLRPWEKLTFEYALLKGVNDSDVDARRVVKLLANLNCKVNLIALNPGPGIPFETPDPERVESFQAIIRLAMPCFIRKPRGRDIFAACGQLKRNA